MTTNVTSLPDRSPLEPARSRARVLRLGAALVALAAALPLGLGLLDPPPAAAVTAFTGPPSLRVSGNHFIDGAGNPIRLIGVNHSGSETLCVEAGQTSIFDPPNTDTPGMIAVMKSWKINAVRVPLNEDCWLGINNPTFGGAAYQSAIVNYVNDLNAAGLAVIVDLHRNAPGTQLSTTGQTSADEDHAPAFWASVAATFKGHPGVVFDLYNEPRYLKFGCLITGGCVAGGIQIAGFNQLISVVRGTGATNVVMVAGTAFAANPTGFRKLMPTDPLNQVAIAVHVYNFNAAKKPAAWAKWVHIGLTLKAPIVTGELGELDCTPNFINNYMAWADANGVSYLPWAFNAGGSWTCAAPSLITDYSGNPTPYGAGYQSHLATLGP